jgi:hypothetical protein
LCASRHPSSIPELLTRLRSGVQAREYEINLAFWPYWLFWVILWETRKSRIRIIRSQSGRLVFFYHLHTSRAVVLIVILCESNRKSVEVLFIF